MTLYRKTLPSGKSRLILPPITATDIPDKKLEKKFLAIHVLNKGDYFGVGEDLKKTYILSVGRVSRRKAVKEVLPDSWKFFKKHILPSFQREMSK